MNALIRTDASAAIGGGHVMRCLALAEALQQLGHAVTFVTRLTEPNLAGRIAAVGATVLELSEGSAGSELLDFEETARVTSRQRFHWVVVDHYALGPHWETQAREIGERILAIEDFVGRPHASDLLLNQNYFRFEPAPDTAAAEAMIGPRYALLRSEFMQRRKSVRPRDGVVRRVLVYFGDSDLEGATVAAMRALLNVGASLTADVVVGAANPRKDEIERYAGKWTGFRLHRAPADMAGLMLASDLSIGAGGVTTWERCCLGLPTIVIALSENQYRGALDLGADGYVVFLGRFSPTTQNSLEEALTDLRRDPERLRRVSVRCASLVDGQGAGRVANRMLAPLLAVRAARPDDCDSILKWRNADEVRLRSRDSRPIAETSHREWFARRIADPNCVLLVGELEGSPIGVVRYDIEKNVATVSVFLSPGRTGMGLGRQLLRRGTEWLRSYHPGVTSIVADVMEGNEASRRAFLAAGYSLETGVLRRRL